MRPVVASLVAASIAALAAGCGGKTSYPPTPGYSTEQVLRVFKAHGLVLHHVPPLEKKSQAHLEAILRTRGTVSVWIYKSRKEAGLAAKLFSRQYTTAKQRRTYQFVLMRNVWAIVPVVDRASARDLKKTVAAMTDLGRMPVH